MKKLLRMILCAVMILMMAACGNAQTETTETTVATTEAIVAENEGTTEAPTEPVPTARDIYNQAVEQLEALDTVTLNITISTTTTLGTDSFAEEDSQTLTLQNLGKDNFAASLSDSVRYGSYGVKIEEVFVDGMMYFDVTPVTEYKKVNYCTPMTAEEYLDRVVPVRLLDSELYDTIENASANVLTFSGALAPEEWLGVSESDLVEASGVVNLDDAGALSRLVYNVTYTKGAATVTMKTTVKVATPAETAIAAPAAAESCQQLEGDDYFGPYLLQHMIGYISQMDTVSSVITESAVSVAAGCVYSRQDTINAFSDTGIQLANIEYLFQMTDMYSGATYFNEVVEENFNNGAYTYTYGSGIPETYQLDYSLMTDSIHTDAVRTIPYQTYIESFEVGNYGGTILVEYQLSDAADKELSTGVTGLILEDKNALDNAASAYRTDEASGYIGIDAATGIPTALGFDYMGTHTIDGLEYALTFNLTQNFMVGHDDTYKEITGEALQRETEGAEATPLFYKVTGANGQEMWLLGTIHVGDERTKNLPQEIDDAFAAADALAVEFDMNAFLEKATTDQELMMQLLQMYMYTDGSVTETHISDPEVYEAALKKLMAAGLVDSTTSLLKTSVWSQNIDNYNLSWNYRLSSDNGMDMQLLAMADEQQKKVLDVESGLEQMQMLTGFSDGLQELLLAGSVSTTPSEYAAQVDELYELWCAGDEEALIAYIIDEESADDSEMTEEEKLLYQEYEKAMYTDRNAAMLETAKEYLESGDVVFFAVGLAHLLAEDGLVNTLRDAGYTVELVPFA